MRTSAITGARWIFLGNLGVQLLSMLTVAWLARVLTPADFGLVTIATVAAGLLAGLSEVGLGAMVIRRGAEDEHFVDSIFWLSVGLAAALTAAGGMLAVPMARLLEADAAAPMVFFASATVAINLVAGVPRGILDLNLRFGTNSALKFSTYAASSVVAITLASGTSLGAWSILWGRFVDSTAGVFLALWYAGYRPRLRFRWESVRHELRFGAGYLATYLCSYAAKNADYWFVARAAGTDALGLYYIAFVLPQIVRQRMTWAFERALFPVLSRTRDEASRLARAYCEAVETVPLITFPILAGLSVTAAEVTSVAFGADWLGAVNAMRVLTLAAAVETVAVPSRPIFLTVGQTWRISSFYVVQLSVMLPGLAVATVIGSLQAFAFAVLFSVVVTTCVTVFVTCRYFDLGFGTISRALFPSVVCTGLMVASVLAVPSVFPDFSSSSAALRLFAQSSVGASTYLLCGFLLFPRQFKNLASIVKIFVGVRGA
jgi:O-antigen/teichoic acid export membrane protein